MRGLFVLACLLGGASTAQAQQTQTYSYDVHGRLITVARMTGSSSQTTTYSLDSADNRTGRTTSVASGGAMAAAPAAKPVADDAPSTAVAMTPTANARPSGSTGSSNAQPSS